MRRLGSAQRKACRKSCARKREEEESRQRRVAAPRSACICRRRRDTPRFRCGAARRRSRSAKAESAVTPLADCRRAAPAAASAAR